MKFNKSIEINILSKRQVNLIIINVHPIFIQSLYPVAIAYPNKIWYLCCETQKNHAFLCPCEKVQLTL